MSISKTYEPNLIENKWYSYWLENKLFASTPNANKTPFTVVIPPPNVTGVLHMGHMLNNTIQDILVRKARMEGKEACWVAGTDHASIATEAKVVAMLKDRGIEKKSLSRDEFLKYAWEWKEKYGGIILEQLKKLGASCDWDRTRFTMEPELSAAVIKVFVDLHSKGLIYRGVRMVNWDPQGKTALSDEEVIFKEVNSKLYHVSYDIEGSDEKITIATTRPETILGDSAICVHPDDERYTHLVGKNAIVPLVNRAIPIIADEYVDKEFGTGCLKVTPAHDLNDYELGIKHKLPVIDILNNDGTLNEKATLFVGEDRFIVRKKITKTLEENGQLVKVEDIKNNVGFSERTDAVIEPRLSLQWFLKMEDLSKPALENVMNDNIKLHPPKFKNMYKSWMENVRDWCISRQLWWGQRIPAFYLPNGDFVVAETPELALVEAQKINPAFTINDLAQDEDVLDTWFSSWLWPISVFDGFKDPENKDINYYYPTDVLVTAPEILFFWVARMVIAGYEYKQELPFKHVYLTGIVRDKLGRKMSKSLGNSPDPLDLIEKFGADGVRVGMLLSSPAGNDLLYDEKLIEQGRNFSNKIWNAFRLVKGWTVDESLPFNNEIAIQWFESKFNKTLAELEDLFAQFRMSDALMTVYKLIWDDFCAWYLEMVKPAYEHPIDAQTYEATLVFFEKLLKLAHPFMPFLTEELWHELRQRTEKESIVISEWPKIEPFNNDLIQKAELSFEIVSAIRNTRNAKGISPKESLQLLVKTNQESFYTEFGPILTKLSNLSEISFATEKPETAISLVIKSEELYIPLAGQIDVEAEREKLSKELEYAKGFLESVEKKLSNEKFVANAKPQIIEAENKKKDDTLSKIKALEEQLKGL